MFAANTGLMKGLSHHHDSFPEARAAFHRLNAEWVETVVTATLRQLDQAGRGGEIGREKLLRRGHALGGMVDQYLSGLILSADPALVAVSDVFSNFTAECDDDMRLHFMAADVLSPELIKPDSGAVVDIKAACHKPESRVCGRARDTLISHAAFCASDDRRAHVHPESEQEARAIVDAIQRVTQAITPGAKPVVGAINCDFPIWAESTRGFFPEVSLNLFLTGAVTTLPPLSVRALKRVLNLAAVPDLHRACNCKPMPRWQVSWTRKPPAASARSERRVSRAFRLGQAGAPAGSASISA